MPLLLIGPDIANDGDDFVDRSMFAVHVEAVFDTVDLF